MLKSFSVRNFRCLEDLELHKMARVNLLVGDNHAGKTALLEAFFTHLSQANASKFIDLKVFRRMPILADETAWRDLFTGMDDSREIHLSSVDLEGRERRSKITVGPTTTVATSLPAASGASLQRFEKSAPRTFRPIQVEYKDATMDEPQRNEVFADPSGSLAQRHRMNPDLRAYYFSTAGVPESERVAQHLSELLVSKQEAMLVALGKAIDERIQGLSVASPKGVTEVFVDLGETQLFPLTLMGSGLVRALGIASAIPVQAGGIVLVDEIENGIYYQRLHHLWKSIFELSKTYDVQIIAATHSAECVNAAIQAVVPDLKDGDPLHVYRLIRGERLPIPYESESLKSVTEFLAEVR